MITYWVIECSQHLVSLYKTKLKATEITEARLIRFLETLLCKYALSDEEILAEFKTKRLYRQIRHLTINRRNNDLDEPLSISFSGHIADIDVCAQLSN